MSETPIIGIDLGTSTSAIAILRDGRPELLPDDQGDRIIPSVVQLTPDGEILVGAAARRGEVAYHDRTAREVKRLMGTGEKVTLGDRTFSPEEIAAMILRHLKASAEAKLRVDSVRDVVLSVPARFDNPAREATKRAAEMAGLNVIRLINEPTAAALSYGLDRLQDNEKVLVFDFGGGTLDVTILEMYQGVLDVKTSVGDDRLGGKDVDDLLIAHIREAYRREWGKDLPPAEEDRRTEQTLKEEAEDYKKELAASYSVMIDIPYLTAEGGVSAMLTKSDFEDMMTEMLERALALVDEALERAELTYEDIDVILPVGGSSRIPLFRRALEQRWGRPLREYDNPDEAVVRGTAIAAGIERKQFEQDGIMILDVSPHRLGVAVVKQVGAGQYLEDYFSEIIPKDAKLPAIERCDYDTLYTGRNTIDIRIYEAASGSNLCMDHRLIDVLPLENIPQAVSDQKVQIEFRYTLDGTLEVSAHCVAAPQVKVDGRFTLNGGASAPEAEEPMDAWLRSDQSKRCRPILEQADKLIETAKPRARGRLTKAAGALRAAIDAGATDEIEAHLATLTDLVYAQS